MANAWEKYRESRAIQVDLDEFGLDDYYVKVIPVATYGSHEIDRINELPQREQHIEMFKLWIVDWNLPGLDGESELPIPKDDEENTWLQVLPQEIQAYIVREVAAVEEERMNLPPEIVRPS